MKTKSCTSCKEVKPLAEFSIVKTGKRTGNPFPKCKVCRNKINKERKERDPSIYRRIEWPSKLKRLYGITVDQYYSMLESQGGGCAICETKVPSSRKRKYASIEMFFVDHCHTTGKVRGLLCSRCNRGIGFFDDSIDKLNSAVNYLEEAKNE
jgi:hypothetical protein